MKVEIKRKSDDYIQETLRQTLGGDNYVYSHMSNEELIHNNLMDGATKEEILPHLRRRIRKNTFIRDETGQMTKQYASAEEVPAQIAEEEYKKGLDYHLREVEELEQMTEEELQEDYEFFKKTYVNPELGGGSIDE